MTMKDAIRRWDAKDAEVIEEVYNRFSREPDFVWNLIVFLPDVDLQQGSTWLLKRYLEHKGKLSEEQTSALLSALTNMQHWEAQLHILQCLPFMSIPKKESKRLHDFLRTTIKSERKFVRAWAYGGLIEVGEQFHEFRDSDLEIIANAYKSEGGSICARIRQAARKSLFWTEVIK